MKDTVARFLEPNTWGRVALPDSSEAHTMRNHGNRRQRRRIPLPRPCPRRTAALRFACFRLWPLPRVCSTLNDNQTSVIPAANRPDDGSKHRQHQRSHRSFHASVAWFYQTLPVLSNISLA